MTSLAAADAWSFALGRAHVLSTIGEPLRVVVDLPALSQEEAETLAVSIAAPDAFQAIGLEYKPLLSNLRVEIERNHDGSARLKLQGSQAVNEAYVDLLLLASWKGGQLTRDYTLLLGPAATAIPPEPYKSTLASTPEPRRAAATPLPPLRPRASAEQTTAPATPSQVARKPAPAPATPQAAAVEAVPVQAPAPAPAKPIAAIPSPITAPVQNSGTVPVTATAATPAAPGEAPVATAPASPSGPAEAPAPAPARVPAPVQPAAPESGWLTQPTTLLATAALLLAGLAGGLVWRRRRQQMHAYADESAAEPAVFGLAAGMSVDTAKAQGPASSMMYSPSQLEASGEIDPIAEADVYLAYGRVQQAEEILRDALRTHPGQVSLHLKLLEIAVQSQNRDAGMALLDQLSGLTKKQGPDWSTANELVARLRADQPETAPATPVETPTAPVMMPPIMAVATASLAPTPPEADEAGPLKGLPVLDLSLDADSVHQPQVSKPAAASEPAAATSSQAAPIELDFDLSLSAPETEMAAAVPDLEFEPAPEPAAPAIPPVPAQTPAADMSLDFDLDLSSPDPAPAVASQPTESQTAPPDNSLEFSLDLDQIGIANPPEQQPTTAPKPAKLDGADLMLDFELEPENKADELADLVVSEDNSASNPLATQLELAQEFLALGDADGARSLAERVLARATGDLQTRARVLLDRLEAARPQ